MLMSDCPTGLPDQRSLVQAPYTTSVSGCVMSIPVSLTTGGAPRLGSSGVVNYLLNIANSKANSKADGGVYSSVFATFSRATRI